MSDSQGLGLGVWTDVDEICGQPHTVSAHLALGEAVMQLTDRVALPDVCLFLQGCPS